MAYLAGLMAFVLMCTPKGVCPTCGGVANMTEDVVVQLVESPTLPSAPGHRTSDVLIDSVNGNSIPTAVRGLTSQTIVEGG